MAMTSQQYVNNDGKKCPYCESSDIRIHGVDGSGDTLLTRSCSCDVCKEVWTEEFMLTGVTELLNSEDED